MTPKILQNYLNILISLIDNVGFFLFFQFFFSWIDFGDPFSSQSYDNFFFLNKFYFRPVHHTSTANKGRIGSSVIQMFGDNIAANLYIYFFLSIGKKGL